ETANTIGGSPAAARNVISGNTTDGVRISGTGTTGNVVAGNYIGTNAAGTAAVPNVQQGVNLAGAPSNFVGTDALGTASPATRNVISGNGDNGVRVTGAGACHNLIPGHFIGPGVTRPTHASN